MDLSQAFYHGPVAGFIWVSTILIGYFTLSYRQHWLDNWLLHPYQIVREGTYYMLISHGFVHANYIHLIINMYVFYYFGFYQEFVVGHVNFLIIYIGSMVISGLISTIRRKDDMGFRSLGASGAISGLVFSFILYNPLEKLLLFFVISLPAWLAGIVFIVGSYYAAKNNYLQGIDHEGHLWGALSGAALTILLEPRILLVFFARLFEAGRLTLGG